MTVRLARPTTTIWQLDVAVLRTLVELLPDGEAALLVDALPPLLAMAARPDPDHRPDPEHRPERFDAAELVRRVRRRTARYDADDRTVRDGVRSALDRVAGYCPAGVLYRVQLPLPDDVRKLFPPPVQVHAAGAG
ncbi:MULTISPECIES: DUF2267 domain-containing protein [unclassified Solwaraspora]|uniref:DUF2267 domain-containing protein n=1 Tax=unclassified Solwaraspora TaxID=2627926 RepID=UPI00248B691B|nr:MULTISPECIES: DUF2267 domain-containing protein [unclassified Solwaraspora]WBB96529.1 DUF2267 domain-containing protein [Solwaraspora sp. WMMA2059]WBC19566.1 DUF2267 domain-containing protein [Solwaraspora sp. WMMA2080]WJK32850.1 DUF2267 domain-containing protein [Solwaraspora sp. WMMA2065]